MIAKPCIDKIFGSAVLCLLATAVLSACGKDAPHTPPTPPKASYPPQPLEHIERYSLGATADETLPMLIALHGMGNCPESFSSEYEGLPFKARIVLPRAPVPWSDSYTWFDVDIPFRTDPNSQTEKIARAADSVAALVRDLIKTKPTVGAPLLTGFSQGAMIVYAVAIRHPTLIGLAVPVSGALPEGLWPTKAVGPTAPFVRAFHGEVDRVVPMELDRKTHRQLSLKGFNATLKGYADVSHAFPAEIKKDVFKTLADFIGNAKK